MQRDFTEFLANKGRPCFWSLNTNILVPSVLLRNKSCQPNRLLTVFLLYISVVNQEAINSIYACMLLTKLNKLLENYLPNWNISIVQTKIKI